MNIEQIKKTVNYLLDNNKRLSEQGLDKIAIHLQGPAGVAKTSILKEIAEDRGAKYVKICLSELNETGDLVGWPQKEYMMLDGEGNEKRVSEKLIKQFTDLGYNLCDHCEPIMTYAIPSWVPQDDCETIINFDDVLRSNPLFLNAIMSILQFGEYVSWKLPKNCHVVLTSNPSEDGYSNFCDFDDAQKSRLLTFPVEFDVQVWAKWAIKQNLNSTAINFALLTPEIFNRKANINARSYAMFANAISGLPDFNSVENLEQVCMIAKACFGDDYVSGLFVQFINNKLDQLISPEDILLKDWKIVKEKLCENIYKGEHYDASIASTLTFRFTNFIENYFNNSLDKKKSEKVIDRIIDICSETEKVLLTEDLLYRMIKRLNAQFSVRCAKLLKYPVIRQKLL